MLLALNNWAMKLEVLTTQPSRASCSKLSMKLLANVTLKFLSGNMTNTLICFAEKLSVAFKLLTFLQQNINVFEETLATTFNECH